MKTIKVEELFVDDLQKLYDNHSLSEGEEWMVHALILYFGGSINW